MSHTLIATCMGSQSGFALSLTCQALFFASNKLERLVRRTILSVPSTSIKVVWLRLRRPLWLQHPLPIILLTAGCSMLNHVIETHFVIKCAWCRGVTSLSNASTPQLTVVVLEKAPSRSIELGHSSSGVVCCSLVSLQFPTFLDLAGVQAEEDLDGRSLKSIFLGEEEEATVRV